jgi:signal transduction histidine kinase
MRKWWIKPITLSLLLSSIVCGFFVAIIFNKTVTNGLELKLQAIEKTARVLAINGEYEKNLNLIGPIPADGSGVLGRLWIVNSEGKILAANSKEPVDKRVLLLLTHLDRSKIEPTEKEIGGFFEGKKFYLQPLKGQNDFLIIENLNKGPVRRWLNFIIILFFIFSSLVCLTVWIFVIWIFRQRSKDVKKVMDRISHGELDARLEIDPIDKKLNLPEDFNFMAQNIQELFMKVKKTEASKLELLKQLAHDIRTPLTSLRAATETLKLNHSRLGPEDFNSLLDISHNESLYLARLVDELLFLSEIKEKQQTHKIEIVEQTKALVEQRRRLNLGLEWLFESNTNQFNFSINQNHWQRIISNIFDNSERYANKQIKIELRKTSDGFCLSVFDDGPGMSDVDIGNYGIKQLNRENNQKGSSSQFGLGAIIIRSLVELSGGTLEISNVLPNGLMVRIDFKG